MKMRLIILMFVFPILLNFSYGDIAFAKKEDKPPKDHGPPPWANNDKDKGRKPPAAPEPIALTLIGMGASGIVGYYLGKKKKDK
jgi:LPXTG-motif cell wall-anchored protein